MDVIKLIKAQQKIYELELDSNAKQLIMLLTVKAFQYGNGDDYFYLTDQRINKMLGYGEKSKHKVINARNVLIENGMIEYEKGNNIKKTKTKYKVNWDNIINIK